MGACGVATHNRRQVGYNEFKMFPVMIEGKQVLCKDPNPFALIRWVHFRYVVPCGAGGIADMCLSCYKEIYGGSPMPSDYQGAEHGRLVTQDILDEEWVDKCKAYEPDLGALQPPPVAPAPVAPAAPVKPALTRQGAQFDLKLFPPRDFRQRKF